MGEVENRKIFHNITRTPSAGPRLQVGRRLAAALPPKGCVQHSVADRDAPRCCVVVISVAREAGALRRRRRVFAHVPRPGRAHLQPHGHILGPVLFRGWIANDLPLNLAQDYARIMIDEYKRRGLESALGLLTTDASEHRG